MAMSRFAAVIAVVTLVVFSPAQAAVLIFSGMLDSTQVVAGGGSTSTAKGSATVYVDTTLFTVATDLTWSGLSGPADRAHLHNGDEGQVTDFSFEHQVLGDVDDPGRSVICPWDTNTFPTCVPVAGSSHDVLQLDASDGWGFPDFNSLVAGFLTDGIYIDMHTELYPAGEIRGQLMPAVPEPSTYVLFGLGLLGVRLLKGSRRFNCDPRAHCRESEEDLSPAI
jgi:hypothetical protein